MDAIKTMAEITSLNVKNVKHAHSGSKLMAMIITLIAVSTHSSDYLIFMRKSVSPFRRPEGYVYKTKSGLHR
jgi:hypothetical protein